MMIETKPLPATLDMIRRLKNVTSMKVNRNFDGFFADRIVQSFSRPTLIDSIEHLAKSVDASIEFIGGKLTASFLTAASTPDAGAVLVWIREHPRIVAMIAALKQDDDYLEAVAAIDPGQVRVPDQSGIAAAPGYDIQIAAQLLSPLSHGSDLKAGNATLFRRRRAITESGRILDLPYYAGNAIRGQMRDLLADHLLHELGLTPRRDKPPISIWFFHALYAGGVLEEQNKAMSGINKDLGQNSSLRTDGIRRLRDHLPTLSLLGAALGNKILPGRIRVGDLRPCCIEWGTGLLPAAELMDWEFLTRREDYEGRTDDDAHTGMIANTEVLRTGTRMAGGIDVDFHTNDLERSALGMGLQLIEDKGALGADTRRGFGKVCFQIEHAPAPELYLSWLVENKESILGYLSEIGALNAPG